MTPFTPVISVSPHDVSGSELFALLSAEYAYMDGRIDPPSSLLTMTAAAIENKMQTETLLVARTAGDLAGCLFCRPEEPWLYIGKLAVSASWRRAGIAKALIDEAGRIALSLGLSGLELETRIELTESHQSFTKMGFEIVDRSSHRGYDRPTSVRMRRINFWHQ